MPIVKIQHADPASSHSIAFDILKADDMETIRDSFILESGHFKLIELSGGMVLREVSHAEVMERLRKTREDQTLEAEVTRERLAREDAERTEQLNAEREQRKEEIAQRLDGEQVDNPDDAPNLNPPNSEDNPPPRHQQEVESQTMDEHLNGAGVHEDQPSELAI